MLPGFSEDARDLLENLLKRNPKQRLGNGEDGVEEIKCHRWFDEIDWEAISTKSVEPPFVPQIESDLDLRNIDRMFTREKPNETPEDSLLL